MPLHLSTTIIIFMGSNGGYEEDEVMWVSLLLFLYHLQPLLQRLKITVNRLQGNCTTNNIKQFKNAHGYNHAIKYFWHTFTSFVDAQVLIEWKYIRVQGLHNVSDVVQ